MSKTGSAQRIRALSVLAAAAAVLAIAAAIAAASGDAASPRCSARGLLPDPGCTPGVIFTQAGVAQVCRAGYSRSVRNVPYALKRRIYFAYGVRRHPRGTYEVDHLIPLELGGSNAAANLWPEAAPGFYTKDRLENALHDSVCSGQITLRAAQRQIASDWRAAWVRAGRP